MSMWILLLKDYWRVSYHIYIKKKAESNLFTIAFAVRGNRPGKQVQLQEHEIKYLCLTARDIFMNQPILLDLEAPIKICGI